MADRVARSLNRLDYDFLGSSDSSALLELIGEYFGGEEQEEALPDDSDSRYPVSHY